MIRFCVHTFVSERDSSGNCYHRSNITSTRSGRTISVDGGWGSDDSNLVHKLREDCRLDWSEIHRTSEMVRKSDFRRMDAAEMREDELTPAMIFRLETTDTYCRPSNTGLASDNRAICAKLAKLFGAMTEVNEHVIDGQLPEEMRGIHFMLRQSLESEGWTISSMNGSLEGTDRINVYPPDSKTGQKIRKWRDDKASA